MTEVFKNPKAVAHKLCAVYDGVSLREIELLGSKKDKLLFRLRCGLIISALAASSMAPGGEDDLQAALNTFGSARA